MSVNIKRVFSCSRSSSLQQHHRGGKEMWQREREEERKKATYTTISYSAIATTASFKCQKQRRSQFIKLSSRSEMKNYYNWIRKEASHCKRHHFRRRKERGDVTVMESKESKDLPGMPGGVFRYFPLKCCITTSHFSVDSILQQKWWMSFRFKGIKYGIQQTTTAFHTIHNSSRQSNNLYRLG